MRNGSFCNLIVKTRSNMYQKIQYPPNLSLYTTRNFIHVDHMFMINVQLMLKSIHFMTTLVTVLHVTIVAKACATML
jgi:hypothetical protein